MIEVPSRARAAADSECASSTAAIDTVPRELARLVGPEALEEGGLLRRLRAKVSAWLGVHVPRELNRQQGNCCIRCRKS